MAKEDATGQAVESSMEQLQDINRKQSEIISAPFVKMAHPAINIFIKREFT